MGKLYLVATPIGNLKDISYRAIEVLNSVDLIACEDTRRTLKLLNHYDIAKPLISYYRHNEDVKSKILIDKIKEGMDIALVSDAGTPVISDPGEEVVRDCIKEGIEVIPIPGACALITALISSGLNTKEFSFYGFLSVNKKYKREKLEEIGKDTKTCIIYEAPHKMIQTLKDILEVIGDRNIVVARELTKVHEEVLRGKVSEIIDKYTNPIGEHVILIEGNSVSEKEEEINELNKLSLDDHYLYYEKQGLSKNDIIKRIAKDKNVSKNDIYQQFLHK